MTDTEWLVALLCPRTVSPHPNFASTDIVTPAGLLGLLVQGRGGAPSAAGDVDVALTADEAELLSAASDAFRAESRLQASRRLAGMAADDRLDAGIATASALLAGMVLADLDHQTEAVELLASAASRVTDSDDSALLIGALKQQEAMRRADAGMEYRDAQRQAERSLRAYAPAKVESFPVSKGARWGAAVTKRKIRELLLESNRDLSELDIGFPDERRLRTLLRRGTSSIAASYLSDASTGLFAFVDERFDAFTRNTAVTVRNADPVDQPIWRALTLFELSGSFRRARYYRRALGMLRLMRATGSDSSVHQDGLRLLRQSGDLKTVNLALARLRAAGPLAALAEEARDVLDLRSSASLLRDVELAVVTAGAQSLDLETAQRGFNTLVEALARPVPRTPGRGQLAAVHAEHLIKAIVAMAPAADRNDELADVLLQHVSDLEDTTDELLVRALGRGLAAVDWAELSEPRRSDWRRWLDKVMTKTVWAKVVQSIAPDLRAEPEAHVPLVSDMNQVAAALNRVIAGEDVPAWLAGEAKDLVAAQLEQVRREAARGMRSFSTTDPADIAAGLCLYADVDLWDALIAFLVDPAVDHGQKAAGLDRLATMPGDLPANARKLVVPSALLSPSRSASPFEQSEINPFPAAIRFLGALDFVPSADLVKAVSSLAAGDVRHRLEAARTVAVLIRSNEVVPDWLTFACFQLTDDSDASVRAEAGRGLALAVHRSDFERPAMIERLQELLNDDGIVVPLLVLRGLVGEEVPTALVPAVRRLAEAHLIEGVRLQAQYVLGSPEA